MPPYILPKTSQNGGLQSSVLGTIRPMRQSFCRWMHLIDAFKLQSFFTPASNCLLSCVASMVNLISPFRCTLKRTFISCLRRQCGPGMPCCCGAQPTPGHLCTLILTTGQGPMLCCMDASGGR